MSLIMAIVNTSPDSFSGDGSLHSEDVADRVHRAVREGADIIDVGGQSTRPGASAIPVGEELRRVIPAIELARSVCNLPISIDTTQVEIASAALASGATIVNSTFSTREEELIKLVAKGKAQLVLTHTRGTARTMQSLTSYPSGVVTDVVRNLARRAEFAVCRGVDEGNLILDPGIGFAKTVERCFQLIRGIRELRGLGYRTMVGASNKSFLGYALSGGPDPIPVSGRQNATTAIGTLAMLQGADIIRVHDVLAASDARRILSCFEEPDDFSLRRTG